MLPDESIALFSPVLLAGPSAWHPDYARVVAYAEVCRRFATGDVAPLLAAYWPSKNEQELRALLALYVPTCDSTWREITTPFYQVGRLRDGQVERKFSYDESLSAAERTRRLEALTQATQRIYNQQPLQDYLAEQVVPTVAMSDPNAWVLLDFAPFDYRTQRAQPYPVLLPSSAVVHFTRSAGTVTSLSARYVVAQDDTSETLHRYTTYLPDHSVSYWPTSKGEPTIPGGVLPTDGVVLDGDKEAYHYRVFAHGAGQVPAVPVGYVRDQGAVGHVFVSPLDAALSFFRLELKTGHELQLVMRNLATPRQLQYVTPCEGIKEDGGCHNGYCSTPQDGNYRDLRCRKCHGTRDSGISSSAADVVRIPLSPNPDENKFKLTDYLAFVGPSPDVPDFQLKYQDWLGDKLKQKIFGTPVLSKTYVAQTATERLSQLDQLAIALTPFADYFSYCYRYLAQVCAAFVDAGGGLEVIYDFPEDLQLKSHRDLYDQLAAAITAGVRADEVESIQNAIARKRHASDPEALRRYFVRSRFIPFLGLPDAMVIQLGALSWVTNEDVVMRFNSDRIFSDIEASEPRFYDLAPARQAELVQAQIDLIKAKLTPPVAAAGNFGKLQLTSQTQPAPPPVAQPDYQVGARISVKPDMAHNMGGMTMGGAGTVALLSGEQAIGVKLDSNPKEVHKWYVPSEIQPSNT